MNWKTFYALLARDGHVARRKSFPCCCRICSSPYCSFIFGARVDH